MKIENLEGYDSYYDWDGAPLSFCTRRKTISYSGIKIILNSLPYLINNRNGDIYFTTPAVKIIKSYVCEAKEKGKNQITINQFSRFNRGKLPIGEKTEFRYSPAEHFFIPGLIRDIPSDGYLTPVYFERHVLVKFEHAEGYRLDRQTVSAGRIHCVNGVNIPYGVNESGYVIMWLGDIVNLPKNEIFYLYSANIEPQYEIHSDFYRNQIMGIWL